MARPISRGTEIIMEYLDRFPKTPSLTLAKKIYKEHSASFKTVENNNVYSIKGLSCEEK